MTRPRGVAWLVVLGLWLAQAGWAQRRISDVEVLVECPWPKIVDRGYVPARVELSNRSGDERRVSISSSGGTWNLNLEAQRSLRVPAGERVRLEILVPAFLSNTSVGSGGSTGLWITVGTEGEFFDLETGTSGWAPNNRAVMLFAAEEPSRVAVAQLETDLLSLVVPDLIEPASRAAGRAIDFAVSLGVAEFDAMPLGSTGYSSLDAVVLDARADLPPSASLEHLAAWVRTGGTLVVFGDANVREALAATPWFEGAFEERFEVAPNAGVWRFGFGRLAVRAGGSLEETADLAFLKDALLETQEPNGAGAPWMPTSSGAWRASMEAIEAPDFGHLPVRAFLLLLLGFAIVIGPVNLFAIRRLARPGLLLITIPALSLLASVGVLAYGVLYQGIGTKAVATTVSLLDQRIARVATIEQRHLFVGMSPGRGLLPAAGTTVFPRGLSGEELTFVIAQGDGIELGRDFLPVRTPVEQVLTSERAARLDLAFEKGAEGAWTVTNRLEVDVAELLLRDLSGGLHRGGPVAPGRSLALEPLSAASVANMEEVRARVTMGRTLQRDVDPEPGTYVARIEENPFRDACNLDIEDQGSIHLLRGILSLDEEEWSH